MGQGQMLPHGGSKGSKAEVPPQQRGGSDAAGPAAGKRSNTEGPTSAAPDRMTREKGFRKDTVG
jgi:hypothetical protein